ncbi:hypothetical protein [Xanthobacter tagetidis]|jgi:hypothetical protein|uniref:Uncharacterized protein n=1 Tax=Xanthobacter tagetidis TaxID=60216 RepID=A0A3L7A719_9HYPH|nr:hypothetical protein [Xanthobacter tagetidis]MBB6307340.1 hypothetical protein [Xanthobacter tagetidis]RLP75875.1 hypothetical protein D9R14_16450 [Xanthobacter tagetidis]
MAIWSGYGFVTAATFALCLVVSPMLGPLLGVEDNLRLATGLLAASIANWVVGRGLNAPEKARVRVDLRTGQLRLEQNPHALLGVPMQYWSPIGIATMLVLLIGSAHAG